MPLKFNLLHMQGIITSEHDLESRQMKFQSASLLIEQSYLVQILPLVTLSRLSLQSHIRHCKAPPAGIPILRSDVADL